MLNRSHPREDPHYFLSMLATDPDQSGKGHVLSLRFTMWRESTGH